MPIPDVVEVVPDELDVVIIRAIHVGAIPIRSRDIEILNGDIGRSALKVDVCIARLYPICPIAGVAVGKLAVENGSPFVLRHEGDRRRSCTGVVEHDRRRIDGLTALRTTSEVAVRSIPAVRHGYGIAGLSKVDSALNSR